jgi:DNA-binding transcriptional ArsR family regulator
VLEAPAANALSEYNRLTTRYTTVWLYPCRIAPPDFDRILGAAADHWRDIVRRAIGGDEGVVELAGHYPMSFAAVQKHVAILERAGLVTKDRVGRRKVVRTNLEGLRVARRLLDQYEELWRGRVDRMTALVADEEGVPMTVTAVRKIQNLTSETPIEPSSRRQLWADRASSSAGGARRPTPRP